MDSSPLLHPEFTQGSAACFALCLLLRACQALACFHHIWASHRAGTMVLLPLNPLPRSRVTSSPRWDLKVDTTA